MTSRDVDAQYPKISNTPVQKIKNLEVGIGIFNFDKSVIFGRIFAEKVSCVSYVLCVEPPIEARKHSIQFRPFEKGRSKGKKRESFKKGILFVIRNVCGPRCRKGKLLAYSDCHRSWPHDRKPTKHKNRHRSDDIIKTSQIGSSFNHCVLGEKCVDNSCRRSGGILQNSL